MVLDSTHFSSPCMPQFTPIRHQFVVWLKLIVSVLPFEDFKCEINEIYWSDLVSLQLYYEDVTICLLQLNVE
jgi:hypothetical protein